LELGLRFFSRLHRWNTYFKPKLSAPQSWIVPWFSSAHRKHRRQETAILSIN